MLFVDLPQKGQLLWLCHIIHFIYFSSGFRNRSKFLSCFRQQNQKSFTDALAFLSNGTVNVLLPKAEMPQSLLERMPKFPASHTSLYSGKLESSSTTGATVGNRHTHNCNVISNMDADLLTSHSNTARKHDALGTPHSTPSNMPLCPPWSMVCLK
jgi:hypothetical protein